MKNEKRPFKIKRQRLKKKKKLLYYFQLIVFQNLKFYLNVQSVFLNAF